MLNTILGCCNELQLSTDTNEIVKDNVFYSYTWEKKMLDTYTTHPIYELNPGYIENKEIYFLYWIATTRNKNRKIKDGAWMVSNIKYILTFDNERDRINNEERHDFDLFYNKQICKFRLAIKLDQILVFWLRV